MPEKRAATKGSNMQVGRAITLLQAIGALCTGLMGLAFLMLAFYLFYTEYRAAAGFRFKFLMMPIMNVLISSMLLFYSRSLYSKAKQTRKAMQNGTFVTPRIIVTRYDIAAIFFFLLVVAVASYFLIR